MFNRLIRFVRAAFFYFLKDLEKLILQDAHAVMLDINSNLLPVISYS